MLRYAVIFLLLAVVAAFLGFSGFGDPLQNIARILFSIFIALFLIAMVLSIATHRRGY